MDMAQVYSGPLNQNGSGFYSGSKFQNGGLVVYSGSRVQSGGLVFDKIIPALKENIKKAYRKVIKPTIRTVGPKLVDHAAPFLLRKASKPISKAVGKDITPFLDMIEPSLKRKAHSVVKQLGSGKRRRKKRKTIFDQ